MTSTPQKRKPRFQRVNTINFRLQERDIEIVRQVYKHRFLNSEHIKALVRGSDKVILKRLQILYHNHYLDRPRQQIQYYEAGSQPMIYGLGNKGADLISERFNVPRTKVDWTSKNREAKSIFLYHTLDVSDFMICLELACRERGNIKLIESDEIISNTPKQTQNQKNPFILKAKGFSVVPDNIFGLWRTGSPESKNNPLYFFLEADRSTMPIKRRTLKATSYFKKMLGYWSAWQDGIFGKTFKIPNARILTITKSKDRIENMIEANKEVDTLKKGSKMFLFTETANIALEKPTKLLEKIWRNGRDEQLVSLV
ncbi:MAG: replication-relaxation family protein [Nitrospinota bacterium]